MKQIYLATWLEYRLTTHNLKQGGGGGGGGAVETSILSYLSVLIAIHFIKGPC